GGDERRQALERRRRARGPRLLRREDEAQALLAGQRDQAEGALVEAREAVLVGHVSERAVEAVGPPVVAAREAARAPRSLRDLVAAMATGVAEGAHAPVLAAHDDERSARGLARDVGAGLGKRRARTEGDGPAAQHGLDLAGEALRRAV